VDVPRRPDHVWEGGVKSQTAVKDGIRWRCGFCSGLRPSVTNRLSVLRPDIAAQLDTALSGVDVDEVVSCSNKSLPWRCPVADDHRWWATPHSRQHRGCPACANHQLSTTNRLDLNAPAIAAELCPLLNEGLTAAQVVVGSKRRVGWRCRHNPEHTWWACVYSRISGQGCPRCHATPRSAQEVRLAHQLAAVLPVSLDEHKVAVAGSRRKADVDILIPLLRIIIEFDVAFWHRGRQEEDRRKIGNLTAAGYRVVRVREAPLEPLCPLDVVVPRNAAAEQVAQAVVDRLKPLVAGLADIDPAGVAARAADAEAHLDRLRADRQVRFQRTKKAAET
jgi:hypothetical protein